MISFGIISAFLLFFHCVFNSVSDCFANGIENCAVGGVLNYAF